MLSNNVCTTFCWSVHLSTDIWVTSAFWLLRTVLDPMGVLSLIKKFFFSHWFIFERQNVSGGGAEREKDTEPKTGSRLWAVSTEPYVGLEPTDHKIMTWAEVGRLTDWATQAPLFLLIFNGYLFLWERECVSRGGAEREEDRICSRLQALSCQHRALCGAGTQELQDHDLNRSRILNRLSHPGTPNILLKKKSRFIKVCTFPKFLHNLKFLSAAFVSIIWMTAGLDTKVTCYSCPPSEFHRTCFPVFWTEHTMRYFSICLNIGFLSLHQNSVNTVGFSLVLTS